MSKFASLPFRIIILEKKKVSIISIVKRGRICYLDGVGCTDWLCCHLEVIWLFVTGLSRPNDSIGESTPTPSGNCWHLMRNMFWVETK